MYSGCCLGVSAEWSRGVPGGQGVRIIWHSFWYLQPTLAWRSGRNFLYTYNLLWCIKVKKNLSGKKGFLCWFKIGGTPHPFIKSLRMIYPIPNLFSHRFQLENWKVSFSILHWKCSVLELEDLSIDLLL